MDYRTAFIASRRTTWFDICCQSLKDQINDNCVLYLDGPVSDKNISQNLQTYKKHFPHGEVVNLSFENYQPLLAWVFLDNFKNPKSELLFIVEDDLIFSHNYIEQLKILYNHTKNNDKFVSWSCFSRASLGMSVDRLVANSRKAVWQHNHIGSMIDMKKLKEVGEDHLSYFLSECNNNPWNVATKNIVKYMFEYMDYAYPIPPSPEDDHIRFITSIGIDSFYCQGIIEHVGKKYRAGAIYNKLKHLGVGGRDDVHGQVQSFYDHEWHKLNYIEDLVPTLDDVDEDYFDKILMKRSSHKKIRSLDDYNAWVAEDKWEIS